MIMAFSSSGTQDLWLLAGECPFSLGVAVTALTVQTWGCCHHEDAGYVVFHLLYPQWMTTSKVYLDSKVEQGVPGYEVEVRN